MGHTHLQGRTLREEHWSLVEYRNGQVGYAPAGFLVVILDTTAEEQERDATKKGQGNSRPTAVNQIGGRIGQEGERRKRYSAAVIYCIKRNTAIYVGDSIIRKTDSRLSKRGRSRVFTGRKNIACDRESRAHHGNRKWRDPTSTRRDEQHRQGRNNRIVEKYWKLLKKTKQARLGQIILTGILPVGGNRIQGYRNSKRMAVKGMMERLCKEEDVGYVDMWDSFVGNEELYFRYGLHLSGKGLPFLPRDCQGRLPVAWVKYDM